MNDYLAVVLAVTAAYAVLHYVVWRIFCWQVHRRHPGLDLKPIAVAFWMPWKR